MSAIGQSHVVGQSGGLAGVKLAHRLLQALPAGIPRVFLNTGNDLNPLGLRIPPDIDTARHTLANLQAGWRRRGQNLDLARALSNQKGGRKS